MGWLFLSRWLGATTSFSATGTCGAPRPVCPCLCPRLCPRLARRPCRHPQRTAPRRRALPPPVGLRLGLLHLPHDRRNPRLLLCRPHPLPHGRRRSLLGLGLPRCSLLHRRLCPTGQARLGRLPHRSLLPHHRLACH